MARWQRCESSASVIIFVGSKAPVDRSSSGYQRLLDKLEVHSIERIYLRQRCFDASIPRVAASTGAQYQYMGFSRRNKIPRCSSYAMG